MSGAITPPSVRDVLFAAKAYGWPSVALGEIVIEEGEDAWRRALTPELAEAVWAVWHDEDDDALDDNPAAEGGAA